MIDRLPATSRNPVTVLIRVVAAVAIVVALLAFTRYVGQRDLMGVLQRAEPLWIVASLAVFLFPLLGNVLALQAAAPVHLPWGLTTAAHLAGTFGNLVTPANIGGMAMNVRFLRSRGVPTANAAGAVGATQFIAVLVTVAVALPNLASSGQIASLASSMISVPTVLIVATVLLSGVLLLRFTSAGHRIRCALRTSLRAFRLALATPGRFCVTVIGNLLVTLGSAAALAAAVQAFGATVPFGDLLIVVAGSALAGIVPLPGAAGGAELILTAQLTAVGLDAPVAFAVAVLYRLVTFWSRIPVGWIAFTWMRRSGHL